MARKHIKLYFRGEPRSTVFPVTEIGGGDNEAGERPTIRTLTGGGHSGELHSQMTLIANTLMEHDRSALASDNLVVQPILTPDRPVKRQNGRRLKDQGEPMFTLTGQDVHGIMEVSNSVDTSGYLREMGRHEIGKHCLTDYRIRRLTPVECERLQGFPDGWTSKGMTPEGKEVEISDTQRYKMCGNAVTTNVITFIGRRILDVFRNV